MRKFTLEISGDRLDQRITKALPELSRSQIAEAIKREEIVVDPEVDCPLKLKPSLRIEKELHLVYKGNGPMEQTLKAQAIDLDILYEDEDIILINKQAGMVVHPAAGHIDGTLVNALLGRMANEYDDLGELEAEEETDAPGLSTVSGRPGIVHRLDRDTSGLLVVARNNYAHRKLAEQWFTDKPKRIYRAIVHGIFQEDEGEIRGSIGRDPNNRLRQAIVPNGREALTKFRVLERFKGASEVACELDTGRTHQIRVHFAAIRHPVFGDPVYGLGEKDYQELNLREEMPPGQCLHAAEFSFYHPRTAERLYFKVDPPPAYMAVRQALERRSHET